MFTFTGLDEKSEDEKAELDSKHVKTWKTINEIRKEHGEKPLEYGDVILDASFLNYIQQKAMADQAASQGDMVDDEEDYDNNEDKEDDDYNYDETEDDESSEDESGEDNNDSDDSDEDTEKSLSKLIITLED